MQDSGTGKSVAPPAEGAAEAGGSGWASPLIWLLLGAGGALAFSSLAGLLLPLVGATPAGRGIAVAAVLAALGIGMALGSPREARGGRRGKSASFLLVLSALFLAASPWIVALLSLAAGPLPGLAAKIPLLSPLLLLAPALAGTLLPAAPLGAAARAILREQEWDGADLSSRALALALLAAGASLGTVNAGFRLLPWGGETAVALAGAILLLLCALPVQATARKPAASGTAPGSPEIAAPSSPAARWVALAWGAAAAAALPAWDRILGLVFGPYPESMSRAAGIFLAGCALGALATAALRISSRRGSLGIAALAGLAGLATGGTLFFADRLPLYLLSLSPLASSAPFAFSVKSWGAAALLVMPAGVAFGALLALLAGPAGEAAGEEGPFRAETLPAGHLLLGALLGSLLVPVWLIPPLGFRSALVSASALILACSGAAFAFSRGSSRLLRAAGIGAILAATLVVAFRGLPGEPRLLASGVYRYAPEILGQFGGDTGAYRKARLSADLPFYREGGEATVAVERVEADVSPILALTRDGAVTGTTFYDLVPQILSAEIPILMRPGARDAFLAGYGTGIGAGSLLLHPLERLDVAEPEPAVVEGSRQFEPANRSPRADRRLHLEPRDPRLALLGKGSGAYDLILCRPGAPESAWGRFQLTDSFYRLAASRLREGGLFAQALPLQGLSPGDLASIAATARSAFSDVMILQTYYQEVLLLGALRPIEFDLEAMRAALGDAKVRSDLARIGLADPDALVVRHRLSGKGMKAFAGEGRILTDRSAPPSFAGYRMGASGTSSRVLEAMDRFSTGLGNRIARLEEGEAGNRRLVALAEAAIAAGDAVRAADLAEALLSRGDAAAGHRILGDAHYLRREQIDSVSEWHLALKADPRNVGALRSLADFSSDRQNYEAAEGYLRTALEASPGDPDLLFQHGRALYYLKRYKEAEADLVKAAAASKEETGSPLGLYYLGLIQKEKGNLTGAAEFLRRYLQWAYAQGRLTPVEADVHLALAEVYEGLHLPDLAEQQRKAAEVLQEKLKEAARSKEKAVLDWLRKP